MGDTGRGRPAAGYVLVMGLAAFLLLAASALPGLRWLDDQWFRQLVLATTAELPAAPLLLVTLPEEAGDAGPQAVAELDLLLQQRALLQRARAVALVADAPLQGALLWSEAGRTLRERLAAAGVLLGLPAEDVAGGGAGWPAQPAHRLDAIAQPWPGYLPLRAPLRPPAQLEPAMGAALEGWPLPAAGGQASWPLLWQQDAALVPDLAARLYAQPPGEFRFDGERLQLGRVGVRSDPFGRILPAAAVAAPAEVPMAALLSGDTRPALAGQWVLIGRAGDPALHGLAAALASLHAPALVHTPGWALVAEKLLIVLLAAYLLLLVPRLGLAVGLLLSGLLAVLAAALQGGLLLVASEWLPLAAPLALLLLGQPLVLWQRGARRRWQRLVEQADAARIALAREHLQQGATEAALAATSGCAATEPLRALRYDIAIGFERRRQFERAAAVLAPLAAGRRPFRDAAQRLEALTALQPLGGWQGATLGPGTLLPSASLAKPVLGRYEVERELGRGSMGVVYLGRDPKIGRQVAIKTLELAQLDEDVQEFRQRFLREAEAAGRLSHPHIVTIYDVGEERDLAFIAMDYMPGRALSAHTEPDHLLALPLLCELLAQVAEALDYAHRQGVVHRDIKPANLLYDERDGRVKVTDFGVARVGDASRTRTGAILGSPSYMSPEQIGGARIDGRSDIFSLGASLFQLLCGRLPFQGDTLAALAYQISRQRHADIRELRPELPPALARIVNKALQKDPARRYVRAGELAAALRKVVVAVREPS